jgi:PAS domain S-box-containing protein
MAHDITARKQSEEARRASEERLQAVLNTATDAIITIDPDGIIQSVNGATEQLFGYRAGELIGHNVKMLMPAPYFDQHDGYLARYRQTGEKHVIGIGREVQARRKDGSSFPVDLALSEFVDQGRRMFTGALRDLSARRALEREVLQVATLEQQRIGQALHDTSGQELTALGLLADSLVKALEVQSPGEARIAAKMDEGIKRVLGQIRAFSRGLIGVEVDAEGLMAALAELAAQTTQLHGVTCTFVCAEPVLLANNEAAAQLYYIAREAVTNALKHAEARNIRITLGRSDDSIRLEVQDDGVGFPGQPLDTKGMGLKIMRYRAGLINGALSVGPAAPTGSIVSCTVAKDEGRGQGERPIEQVGGPGHDRG